MEAIRCRLRPLLRPLISSKYTRTQRHTRSFFYSTSDKPSFRNQPIFSDDPEERSTGSLVYRQNLRTQRPSTIRWQNDLRNSASFIGRVNSPLRTLTIDDKLVVHTQLRVESSSQSKKFFTIFLDMWEDMAELCIQHIKQNDFICVSGYLRSFTTVYETRIRLNYKVIVKEINFVANNDQTTEDPGESVEEKRRKRLHLWQVFFASPYEWKDLRNRKVNPKQPDFKHKTTGEALWISEFDPPWISRQLELQDSRMGGMNFGDNLTRTSNLSPLSYDES